MRHLLNFMLSLLEDFGMTDFYLELSTRDTEGDKKDKFIGTDEQWEQATAVLEQVAKETGLELVPDPGGAAFYGPKISVQAKDAIGRTGRCLPCSMTSTSPAGLVGVPGCGRLNPGAGDDSLGQVRFD